MKGLTGVMGALASLYTLCAVANLIMRDLPLWSVLGILVFEALFVGGFVACWKRIHSPEYQNLQEVKRERSLLRKEEKRQMKVTKKAKKEEKKSARQTVRAEKQREKWLRDKPKRDQEWAKAQDRKPVEAVVVSTQERRTGSVVSAAGRGLVGGMIAGPVGAVIGAATGTSFVNGQKVTFAVKYASGRKGTETVEVGTKRFEEIAKVMLK